MALTIIFLCQGCGVAVCAAGRVWGADAQRVDRRLRPHPQRPFLGRALAQPGLEGSAAHAGDAGASDALPRHGEPGDRGTCMAGAGTGGAGVQRMEE